jgi:hypothetical protein
VFKLPLIFSLLLHFSGQGQDKSPVKFGKISAEDFKTIYTIDNNAPAVVIADIGSSEITGNLKGWFSIEFRHFKRIHILKEKAFDLADVEIMLYKEDNNEEELKTIRAHTYNLENGKILQTKLDTKKSVYSTALSKNQLAKKFTFPAVKAGSIIEFEYTINSDFIFNMHPWFFQGDHPCLWSEYNVSIPDFLYYVFLQQGKIDKTKKIRQERFSIINTRGSSPTSSEPLMASVTDYRLLMKNIPALKEESYTTTLSNHIAKVEFQLAEIRPPLEQRDIMGDWSGAVETLLQDEYFGAQLSRDNSWMSEELKHALRGAVQELEKANNIYHHIQSTFNCTNYNKIYADQPLKSILKNRTGSEAEINLLLVAMLRKAGLVADPLLLSTRSHGYVYPDYPLMDRFNYVIARLKISDQIYFLDASRPYLGFGRLHWSCYNGHARVINADTTVVEFSPDSLLEIKTTSVMITAGEKGDLVGTLQTIPGYFESLEYRGLINDEGQSAFLKLLNRDAGANLEIRNLRMDSLEKLNEPLQVNYDLKISAGGEEIIYLNPMLGEGYPENPFRSVTRNYPVEMPYASDETYLFQMNVPANYEIDNLPKSTRVNLDEDGKSFFEYLIDYSGGIISLRSRISLSRTYFLPEEYDLLREFFTTIANAHSSQIVLKKKKQL